MFRALLRKSLSQARLVVLTGIGVTLAFPLLLGFGLQVMGATTTTLQDALTTGWGFFLVLGFWPLWMWLITLQVFTGDRAAGAEAFLLERPVRSSQVWLARATASWIAFAPFCLASLVGLGIVARLLGGLSWPALTAGSGDLLAGAAAVMPLAFAAGAFSAACGPSGFSALYLAVLMAGLPLFPAYFAANLITRISFTIHPLIAPLVMIEGVAAVYLVTAFLMQAKGEPLGRGRLRRGFVTLAAGLTALSVFLAAGGAAIWMTRTPEAIRVVASPAGKSALILAHRGAWLVDVPTGKKVKFFMGYPQDAQWNSRGDQFALVEGDPLFAGRGDFGQVRVFDEGGMEIGKPATPDPGLFVTWLAWSGDQVVFGAAEPGGGSFLYRMFPGNSPRPRLVASFPGCILRPRRDLLDGSLVVEKYTRAEGRSLVRGGQRWLNEREFFEYDRKAEKLAPRAWTEIERLSPSGRFRLVRESQNPARWKVHSLQDEGLDWPQEMPGNPGLRYTWMAEDRLAWVEPAGNQFCLRLSDPQGSLETLGCSLHPVVWMDLDPSREKLLWFWADQKTRRGDGVLHFFDGKTGGTSELHLGREVRQAEWLGGKNLALYSGQGLYFLDLDHPAEPKAVVGPAWKRSKN